MHSGKDKAPKEVKLTLDEKNTLNWKSINSRSLIGAFKKNTMDIKNVKMIEWGKRTETFQKDMAASTPEELCLSLVGEDGATLDFEVTSKVERAPDWGVTRSAASLWRLISRRAHSRHRPSRPCPRPCCCSPGCCPGRRRSGWPFAAVPPASSGPWT